MKRMLVNRMRGCFNSTCFVFLFCALSTGFTTVDPANRLVGIWESEEKNLQIEMFEDGDHYAGRMIYFKCESDDVMRSLEDTENPDETLTGRKLLGLMLVTKLAYQGEDVWDDGKIYDPNSGYTFEARIQLTDPNTAIVRGYWKYRWFGKSMVFKRK
jgi:uncharacterized protein (DUF2147 family)